LYAKPFSPVLQGFLSIIALTPGGPSVYTEALRKPMPHHGIKTFERWLRRGPSSFTRRLQILFHRLCKALADAAFACTIRYMTEILNRKTVMGGAS
jgi:hypothetical protein